MSRIFEVIADLRRLGGGVLCGALIFAAGMACATEQNFDGKWEGRGFTHGPDDCPSFDVYIAVAAGQANGRFVEGQHGTDVAFELDENGEFSGSFRTRSNHLVRIDGSYNGGQLKGYLNHPICRGTWYAKRIQEAAPQAAATRQPAAVPKDLSLVEQLKVLQDLRQQKLIDNETYEERRNALLNSMLADSGGSQKAETSAQGAAGTAAQTAARPPAKIAGLELGRFFALIIANNNYRYLPDLVAAVPDGMAVAQKLRDSYGFNVELLIDADRYSIISALVRMRAELKESDYFLIYYAGHGILDEASGEGYWLPVDGEADNLANWVANADVTSAIRAMQARHIMLIIDSCYSGTLTRDALTSLPRSEDEQAWFRRASEKIARTVLTSGGLEPVVDGGGGKHSVFAKAFLTALEENQDIMDGQMVFSRIKRPVVVNARQTPEYADIRFTGHDGGDFLFVRAR